MAGCWRKHCSGLDLPVLTSPVLISCSLPVVDREMIAIVGKLIARRLSRPYQFCWRCRRCYSACCGRCRLTLRRCRCRQPPHLKKSRPSDTKWASIGRCREQYVIWLADALHGDFGRSIQFRRDSGSLVATTLPATIQLAVSAMIIAAILGIGGGLLMFRVRGTVLEPVTDMVSILLLSIPEFLWGLILLFVFGVALHLLPFTGQVAPELPAPRITGFLLLELSARRPPRCFLECVPAFDSSRRRTRACVLADHHARSAIESVRRLS